LSPERHETPRPLKPKAGWGDSRLLGVWEALAITAIALVARFVHLDTVVHVDDYLQVLAARSWLQEGHLGIGGEQEYTRAFLYTYLVAGFMALFGESTYAARLPAAIAGAAWVTALFLWVRFVAGRGAAWIAAILFCFNPVVLELSWMVRFYTLHGLVFFVGAIGVLHLAERTPAWPRSLILGGGLLLAFSLSYHLQVTTIVGLMGLSAWLIIGYAPVVRDAAARLPRRTAWSIGMGVVLLLGVTFLLGRPVAALFWDRFQTVPLWAASRQDDLLYYYHQMRRPYPLLWGLFPAAIIVAIAAVGRPAVFATVLFSIPFLVHSLAAFKQDRFLAYAFPFFFAIWGIAIASLVPPLIRAARVTVARTFGSNEERRMVRVGALGLVTVSVLAVVVTNPAAAAGIRMSLPGRLPAEYVGADWRSPATLLGPELAASELVLVSTGAPALFALDRVDFLVSRGAGPFEFGKNALMGVGVIAKGESLRELVRCHRSGIVLVEAGRWGMDWVADEAFFALLETELDPVPLPPQAMFRVYRWNGGVNWVGPMDCPSLEDRAIAPTSP